LSLERNRSSDKKSRQIKSLERILIAKVCQLLRKFALAAQSGHYADCGTSQPWGYVEGNGAFVARFTDANGHVSRAVGKLNGSSGKGAWSPGSAVVLRRNQTVIRQAPA